MKVSIVVPTYNAAKYITATLDSILSQDVDLECLVMDGGSTDGTVDILRGYGNRIAWVSEKDRGQSHAINKGMRLAQGDILAYLCASDVYLPGALSKVVAYFEAHRQCQWFYGKCQLIDAAGNMGEIPSVPFNFTQLLGGNYIPQPATFWRCNLLDKIGYFDEHLDYTMDYDYWLRVGKTTHPDCFPEYLAVFRIHPDAKTQRYRETEVEARMVARRYAGGWSLRVRVPISRFMGVVRTKGFRTACRNALRYARDCGVAGIRPIVPSVWIPCRRGGVWYWLNKADDLAYGMMMLPGNFERAERRFISRFIQPGWQVVDIGANWGLYTILMAKLVGPSGLVVAFEPIPSMNTLLARNVELNRFKNVIAVASAVGSKPGDATMWECLDGREAFSSLRDPGVGLTRQIIAPVTSLDVYCDFVKYLQPKFIKIDAEGAELSILRGARETLAKFKPAIMCEFCDARTVKWGYSCTEIYRLLESWGYSWYQIAQDDTLDPAPMKEHYDYENLVAMPK
jgi:FkbM family methyltransferase